MTDDEFWTDFDNRSKAMSSVELMATPTVSSLGGQRGPSAAVVPAVESTFDLPDDDTHADAALPTSGPPNIGGESLSLPSGDFGSSDSELSLPDGGTFSESSLSTPGEPTDFSSESLSVSAPPAASGERLALPEAETPSQTTLDAPNAPSVRHEALETAPAPPANRVDLALPTAPQTPTTTLDAPRVTETGRGRTLQMPTAPPRAVGPNRSAHSLEAPNPPPDQVLSTSQNPMMPGEMLPTNYVPIDGGELYAHPAAAGLPFEDSGDDQMAMWGSMLNNQFASLNERVFEETERRMQEQAILMTLPESDY